MIRKPKRTPKIRFEVTRDSQPTRPFYTTTSLEEFNRFKKTRKLGRELADKGFMEYEAAYGRLSNGLSVKLSKDGKITGGAYANPEIYQPENIFHHEKEHFREIIFLQRHGFKRNSKSILANIAEMIFTRMNERSSTTAYPSFKEIRQYANNPTSRKLHELEVIGLCLNHFATKQLPGLIVQLFRNPKTRSALRVMNRIKIERPRKQDIPAQEKQLRKALLTLVDFLERYAQNQDKIRIARFKK